MNGLIKMRREVVAERRKESGVEEEVTESDKLLDEMISMIDSSAKDSKPVNREAAAQLRDRALAEVAIAEEEKPKPKRPKPADSLDDAFSEFMKAQSSYMRTKAAAEEKAAEAALLRAKAELLRAETEAKKNQ